MLLEALKHVILLLLSSLSVIIQVSVSSCCHSDGLAEAIAFVLVLASHCLYIDRERVFRNKIDVDHLSRDAGLFGFVKLTRLLVTRLSRSLLPGLQLQKFYFVHVPWETQVVMKLSLARNLAWLLIQTLCF